MPLFRSAVEALAALRSCPWESLSRRATGAAASLLPVPADLAGVRVSRRVAGSCGDGGATWMPVAGCRDWQDDPDVHAEADLLRCWSRGRLREVLHAARLADERRDAAAAAFALRRVEAFRRRCPSGACVHWASGMEIALRAVRLLHAAAHLAAARDAGVAVPSLAPLAEALAEHERALESRADWRLHRTGNHYLVALAARVVAASSLPPCDERRRRLRRDAALLQRESRRQFPGGLHFESALGYHALAADALHHARLALEASGLPAALPLDEVDVATSALLRPDGTLAAMGDGDDESFVPSHLAAEPPPPAALVAGASARLVPSLAARAFPHAACAVLASPGPPAVHATISAFGAGRGGNGGHAHDDATAYDLWLGGPLIADRGTGAYAADPALRELLRGVRSHAVVQVDAREMNDAVPGHAFRRRHRAWPTLSWETTPEGTPRVLVGHHGFGTPAPGAVVWRRLALAERSGAPAGLVVEDEITGAGTHDLVLRLPWAPGARPGASRSEPASGVAFDVVRDGAPPALCRVSARCPAGPLALEVAHREAVHSPRQGEVLPALTTEVRMRSALPVVIRHEVILRDGA